MSDTLTKSQCLYLADVNSAPHESSHLAAAISRGIPAIARIGFDGKSSGRMNDDDTGVSLESGLFITFAGITVTEKFHLRKAGLVLDFKDIDNALLPLPIAEAAVLKAKVHQDAEIFVGQQLGCIFRLALALIEKRYLDERTAKKVFEGQINIDVPDEFCDALKRLPYVVWLEQGRGGRQAIALHERRSRTLRRIGGVESKMRDRGTITCRAVIALVSFGEGRPPMPILLAYSEIDLETRCENQVENEIDRRPIRAGDLILSEDYKRDYPEAIHRPTAPTRKYNCHGLTFASRRTWISKASEVKKILRDDDYVPVELREVMPGDIVVYSQNGDEEHSGIVVEKGDVPIILSKWGPAHEVIHLVNDSPYNSMQISYYRIKT